MKIRSLFTNLLLYIGLAVPMYGAQTPDSLDLARLALIGGATVGGFAVGHGVLNTMWWKGEFVPFHLNVEQDWKYALGADKAGHAFFPYATSTIYSQAFQWSGMDSSTAVITASCLALTYQTYIEIRDGFSKEYGFSPGDMAADILGSALPVVQHYCPSLRNFEMQISFRPSTAFRRGGYGSIIDDYTSTQHWLSCDIGRMAFPESTWFPRWIGLALGHTVENLDGVGGGNHVFLIGIDWNLAEIPGLPKWLQTVLRNVHLYHLPAPTLRLAPGRTTITL